jgi:anti-sigma-K factor RskA
MSVHEQFADDLPLYAMGALEGNERLAVEEHLLGCFVCQRELEQLRGDLALLGLSVSGSKPPSRCRKRLLAAIAKEPRRRLTRFSVREIWLSVFAWVIAVAAMVAILALFEQNTSLRRRIAGLEARFTAEQQQLMEAKELIASLNSPEAVHFTLVEGKALPQPQGRAFYVTRNGTLLFLASDMPQLPPQKTYELWLIPSAGAPIPAGLFTPDTSGSATVINPPLPTGVKAKTFAITIEPKAGSPAPTSQPIMVGTRV